MKENRQIVERWRQGMGAVLATLVRVQGSSYRRAGAHLLLCKDGSYEGSISAGCLEADLLRKAAWLVRDGAVVRNYSTLFDETSDMPFGLGCGGVLDVLLEPVETDECQAMLRAMEDTLLGSPHWIVTWAPAHDRPLQRAILRAQGEMVFASHALSAERMGEARLVPFSGDDSSTESTFIDRLVPPQRFFIFGAGDDAKPLAAMAHSLGWEVTVADGRTHLARRERFPDPGIRIASDVPSALQEMERRDAAVLMTHSFGQDRELLAALLALKPKYLGLLGSRQRSALLIADAAPKLSMSLSECCKQLAAPIGLNIGAEGPEAIALSILAEAQAYCAGKQGDFRKLSPDLVEQYLAEDNPFPLQAPQCGLDWA
jgi:xanthine dehydrogenase accessory factor